MSRDYFNDTPRPIPSKPFELPPDVTYEDICKALDDYFYDITRVYSPETRQRVTEAYALGKGVKFTRRFVNSYTFGDCSFKQTRDGYFLIRIRDDFRNCSIATRLFKIHEIGAHMGQINERYLKEVERLRKESKRTPTTPAREKKANEMLRFNAAYKIEKAAFDNAYERYLEMTAAISDSVVKAIPKWALEEDAKRAAPKYQQRLALFYEEMCGYSYHSFCALAPRSEGKILPKEEFDKLHAFPDVKAHDEIMRSRDALRDRSDYTAHLRTHFRNANAETSKKSMAMSLKRLFRRTPSSSPEGVKPA